MLPGHATLRKQNQAFEMIPANKEDKISKERSGLSRERAGPKQIIYWVLQTGQGSKTCRASGHQHG